MSTLNRWIFGAVMLITPQLACAQPYSGFGDFQKLGETELQSLQVKLTYLGPVDYPVYSLIFTSTGGTIDVGAFTPFRRNAFVTEYGLDGLGPRSFKVSTAILAAMIDSIAGLAGVTDGGVDSGGVVSFAMLETSGDTTAFESIVDTTNGRALVSKMLAAFGSQPEALRATTEAACRYDLLAGSPPMNVTAQVLIKTSGPRRLRKTDEYSIQIRITNTSKATLALPLTLVPRIVGANVVLLDEDGFTCAIDPMGVPYVNLVAEGGLAPSESLDVTVRIRNPSNERLRITPEVFAGTGTR